MGGSSLFFFCQQIFEHLLCDILLGTDLSEPEPQNTEFSVFRDGTQLVILDAKENSVHPVGLGFETSFSPVVALLS